MRPRSAAPHRARDRPRERRDRHLRVGPRHELPLDLDGPGPRAVRPGRTRSRPAATTPSGPCHRRRRRHRDERVSWTSERAWAEPSDPRPTPIRHDRARNGPTLRSQRDAHRDPGSRDAHADRERRRPRGRTPRRRRRLSAPSRHADADRPTPNSATTATPTPTAHGGRQRPHPPRRRRRRLRPGQTTTRPALRRPRSRPRRPTTTPGPTSTPTQTSRRRRRSLLRPTPTPSLDRPRPRARRAPSTLPAPRQSNRTPPVPRPLRSWAGLSRGQCAGAGPGAACKVRLPAAPGRLRSAFRPRRPWFRARPRHVHREQQRTLDVKPVRCVARATVSVRWLLRRRVRRRCGGTGDHARRLRPLAAQRPDIGHLATLLGRSALVPRGGPRRGSVRDLYGATRSRRATWTVTARSRSRSRRPTAR